MKYFPTRWMLMLIVIVGQTFVCVNNAQTKNRVNELPKPPDYEYYVGTKVGFSLLKKCKALDGTIRRINGSKITFFISENLTGELFGKSIIDLEYAAPKVRNATPSTWSFVDIKEGNELIIFYCKEQDQKATYSFITSDKNLLPSIKKSIRHYNNALQNPEILSNAPDVFRISNDIIFLGYIVELLSGSLRYADYASLVLSELLETDKIPEGEVGLINLTLSDFLTGNSLLGIKEETINKSLKILIDLGSSDKKLNGQAIRILINVAEANSSILQPLLTEQNKIRLLKNLRALPVNQRYNDKQKKLELLLSSN